MKQYTKNKNRFLNHDCNAYWRAQSADITGAKKDTVI